MDDRIRNLELEIEEIKSQRKKEKRKKKEENTWVAVKKHLPSSDTLRVIAWAKDEMVPAWFANDKFYSFDGTWFYTEKELLTDVTHWVPRDWMSTPDWPLYGPGIIRWVRFQWDRLTRRASGVMRDLRPRGYGKNAQLSQKIVYYANERTGEIRMGLPENFPVSKGFNKVVCNSARESEAWSERLRKYNLSKERRIDEQRERIEGEAAKEIRSNIHHLMANSHSKYGRVFMERYLERMDKAESKWRTEREEYNHLEAYEHRK